MHFININPRHKLNKLIVFGSIMLVAGIAADYFVEQGMYGFWIGALMGAGGGAIIIGISKKFS